MGRYLIDTSTLIELSRRREPATSRIRSLMTAENAVGTCAIVVTEFYTGLSSRLIALGAEMFSSLEYWDIGMSTAIKAAGYRHDFARRGIQLGTPDVLIAAVAFEQQAVIVTLNVRDFPMSDVVVMPIPVTDR